MWRVHLPSHKLLAHNCLRAVLKLSLANIKTRQGYMETEKKISNLISYELQLKSLENLKSVHGGAEKYMA